MLATDSRNVGSKAASHSMNLQARACPRHVPLSDD